MDIQIKNCFKVFGLCLADFSPSNERWDRTNTENVTTLTVANLINNLRS